MLAQAGISKTIIEISGPFFVMLAIAGIQEFYFWMPAGVYPVEKRGRNDGRMRNDFEVDLKSTFFWNPSPFRILSKVL